MLAASDRHAKNFGVSSSPRGVFHLTPRYDVLSASVTGTAAGQVSPHKVRMAMAVWGKNRHYRWTEMRRVHFEATAADCKLRDAGLLIAQFVERTPQAIEQVRAQLPKSFPGQVSGPIFDGLSRAAAALAKTNAAMDSR